MADFGDFKEPTPAAETFSMPPRESSLDDFEKLENFCITDKPESESHSEHDNKGITKREDSPPALDSKPTQPFDEFIRPAKQEDSPEDEFKDNVTMSSSGSNDPYSELLGFGTSDRSPQVTSLSGSVGNGSYGTGSLLDFDMPATAPVSEAVSALSKNEDHFGAGFHHAEKLVHPLQAPCDSGYEPSPSDETAAGKEPPVVDTRFDKIVPSAPEIEHHAADSLVSGQQHRRSPSPVEIPRQQEIPITKAAVPSSAPTHSPRKMSNEEVSSTKELAGPGCPFSPSALFDPKRLHPCVTQLVYWQDPKKSGGVFGSLLLLLLSLRFFSLISVASYLALGLLTVTLSFRIYKNILQAVQKSGDGHPFKEYLEYDLNVPQDKVHDTADTLVKHVNTALQKLRSLFLVEDLVDSIKLGIVLWTLTYLGAWFNGLTLIILAVIAAFTLPKLYESNQTIIDQYLSLAGAQVSGVLSVVKSKIPFGKKEKSQ